MILLSSFCISCPINFEKVIKGVKCPGIPEVYSLINGGYYVNPFTEPTSPCLLYIQGEDYVLVLQMEIIKLMIFG